MDSLRAVESAAWLRHEKFYAVIVGGAKELGQFVETTAKVSSFVIMDNLVRHDRALQNVKVRDRALSCTVFEIGDVQ